MTRVEWNKAGERFFETGVGQGVLYPRLGPGVAWNGLVSVGESTTGGEGEALHFDGVKYRDLISAEDFQAVLEAFAAPPEFADCDGSKQLSPGLFVTQQPRSLFGLSYRTLLGNDLVGSDYGYKLHVVYNCLASPSGRTHQTIGANVNPSTRSWQISTVPPPSSTFRPTAHLVVDSTLAAPVKLEALESVLYGADAAVPRLPTIAEIVAILA